MSPTRALRHCAVPGCPVLVQAGRCQAHGGTGRSSVGISGWQARPSAAPVTRIRGPELQRLRADLFAREPWCRLCARRGQRTLATIRDHVVNLDAGGSEDEANVQPLCVPCHNAKTHGESMRGRG